MLRMLVCAWGMLWKCVLWGKRFLSFQAQTLFSLQERMFYRIPHWNQKFFISILDQKLSRAIGRSSCWDRALKTKMSPASQVFSNCLSMCVPRPCSKIPSTLDWDIKECEARPTMTCWMNLWRLCHRGKFSLAHSSLRAHRLWAVCCWHVDVDSTWCYWEKKCWAV